VVHPEELILVKQILLVPCAYGQALLTVWPGMMSVALEGWPPTFMPRMQAHVLAPDAVIESIEALLAVHRKIYFGSIGL
jgi:hypothetical protein